MGTFTQGLSVSFYGIMITFIALALVILLIRLLLALFPGQPRTAPPGPLAQEDDPNIPRVVAFAAAWWLKQKKDRSSLGERLESPPGNWWNKAKK